MPRRGGSAGGLEQGALVAVGTVDHPATQGTTRRFRCGASRTSTWKLNGYSSPTVRVEAHNGWCESVSTD